MSEDMRLDLIKTLEWFMDMNLGHLDGTDMFNGEYNGTDLDRLEYIKESLEKNLLGG